MIKIVRKGGDALVPKPRPGRARSLSDFEAEEVKRWVICGDPRQYGFDFGLWTRQIIADLIKDRLGIPLGLTAVGDLLHRVGLTPQKPMRRAYERDDAEINQWKEETYPKIKQLAKKEGAEIFWLDEASIRSDDPLMRTWGLKGHRHLQFKPAAKDKALMLFQRSRIQVVFGIMFIQSALIQMFLSSV